MTTPLFSTGHVLAGRSQHMANRLLQASRHRANPSRVDWPSLLRLRSSLCASVHLDRPCLVYAWQYDGSVRLLAIAERNDHPAHLRPRAPYQADDPERFFYATSLSIATSLPFSLRNAVSDRPCLSPVRTSRRPISRQHRVATRQSLALSPLTDQAAPISSRLTRLLPVHVDSPNRAQATLNMATRLI